MKSVEQWPATPAVTERRGDLTQLSIALCAIALRALPEYGAARVVKRGTHLWVHVEPLLGAPLDWVARKEERFARPASGPLSVLTANRGVCRGPYHHPGPTP